MCVAKTTSLYDSAYPVLYCDEGLNVVDMNARAYAEHGSGLRADCIIQCFRPEDVKNFRAMMFSKAKKYRPVYVEACVTGLFGYRYALIVRRNLFGKRLAEIRLFRSRSEMLSSYESYELMMPVKTKLPDYPLCGGRAGNEATAEELNDVFVCNMLSNMYSSAASASFAIESFDLIKIEELQLCLYI